MPQRRQRPRPSWFDIEPGAKRSPERGDAIANRLRKSGQQEFAGRVSSDCPLPPIAARKQIGNFSPVSAVRDRSGVRHLPERAAAATA